MCAISVIVPVYKAEAYLRKCIEGILQQTFTDFQLILVDDGSPDKSGEICDEFARKDSRVEVIHKANGGLTSARKYGMKCARGIYSIHIDPDDWVEPLLLEELYKEATEKMPIWLSVTFGSTAITRSFIQSKSRKLLIIKR
jgi:glycosyltransferase